MGTGPDERDGGTPAAGDAGHEQSLTFPDLPRLELDQLLGQMIERAHEVMAAQGRLRGLLRANQLITGQLALPRLLRGVVEAAAELIGARYAALGVVSEQGGLTEFVHTGIPADVVDRIGHLPEGKGLLGALIEDPRPIRLDRIGDDPRSTGFPADHPPMNSFLGVPIKISDRVFGNLYLTESTKGAFTAEDEELARALASTAAIAIENARLYEAARTRGEWMQASAAITGQLLSPASPGEADTLRLIAERSREIARAALVTVVRPTEEGDELKVEVAVGPLGGTVQGVTVRSDTSVAGRVLAGGEPLRLADVEQAGLATSLLKGLNLGPVLVLPMRGSDRIHGVVTVGRAQGEPTFTAEDLAMAAGFANQAAVAIELAEARAEQERAAMLDDRERIAADLHDHVIQRIFAAGLSLQAVVAGLGPGKNSERLRTTIDDLDVTITQIRTAIFQLQEVPDRPAQGPRARLLAVTEEQTRTLGFSPSVRFSGVMDTLPGPLVEDLLAVLREGLSNVARHARAHLVDVEVRTTGERLILDLRDDGVGLGASTRRSGLANLRRRAEQRGGTFTVQDVEPRGTRLVWSVPLV
jgi:signal transduction histidine kinase